MKALFISLLLLLTTWSAAQSTIVRTEVSGTRSMTTVNAQQLHDELTALLAAQNLTATDVSALTAAFNSLPPIPMAVSDLTNDVGYTTFNGDYSSLTNAPTSVTAFDDVTDAGSGAIITSTERTLLASLSNALALIDSMSAELTILQTANNLSFTCGGLYYFDGHAYESVEIGTQCWFAENLRTTHYNDGTEIPSGLSNAEWIDAAGASLGATAVYGEGDSYCEGACDESSNLVDYGRLYNWYAVDDPRGLCPSGWHVPTDEEFTMLNETLNGGSVYGGDVFKSSSEDSPSWDGSNDSGFSALPSGLRYNFNGKFLNQGESAYFWSSSPSSSSAWYRILSTGEDVIYRYDYYHKNTGFSVRCIQG